MVAAGARQSVRSWRGVVCKTRSEKQKQKQFSAIGHTSKINARIWNSIGEQKWSREETKKKPTKKKQKQQRKENIKDTKIRAQC